MADPALNAKIDANADGFVKETKRARDAFGKFTKTAGQASKVGAGLGTGTRQLGLFSRAAGTARAGLSRLAGGATVVFGAFSKVASVAGQVVSSILSIAKRAGLAAAALTAIGTAAVVSFGKFESSFAQVRTLIDETQVDTEELSQGLRDLAATYGVDLKTAVDAAYQAISAGQDPATVLQFLEASFQGAAAGAATAEEAVDLFTTVLNAFGSPAGDVNKVADIMFATIKAGKTTAAELAESVGQVAPVAAAAGVSVEGMGAALAALTASGLSTAEAATALKATIVGILKPSTDAEAALNAIGVSAASLAEEGLEETMRKVAEETQGNAEAMARLFPNIRALVGVSNLAGTGFEKFTTSMRATENAAGAAGEAFGKTATTIGFSFGQLRATVAETFRTLGEALAPVAQGIIDAFQSVFTETKLEMEALAQVFEDRANQMGDSIRGLGSDIRKSGGLITISLRLVAKAFKTVGNIIDAVKKPISGIIAGFDLLARVLRTIVVGAVSLTLEPLTALVRVGSLIPKVLLEAARVAAEGLGLDTMAKKIRSAQRSLNDVTDQVVAFQQSLRDSTEESARAIADFDQTYTSSVQTFNRASASVRGAGDDLNEFADDVVETKERVRELREAMKAARDEAAQYGLQQTEAANAVKVLAEQVGGGQRALELFRSAMDALKNPTATERAELERLGITADLLAREGLNATLVKIRDITTASQSAQSRLQAVSGDMGNLVRVAQEAGGSIRGFNAALARTGQSGQQAAGGLTAAAQGANGLAGAFAQGATQGQRLAQVLASLGQQGGQAARGLGQLPKEIQEVVRGLQAIGQAKTPAQALEEQQATLSQLLQQADRELDAAIERASQRGQVTLREAEAAREAAMQRVQRALDEGRVDQEGAARAIANINRTYEDSVQGVNRAFQEQRRVAQEAYDAVLQQIGQLEGGLKAIRDNAIASASAEGEAAIQQARERTAEAIQQIHDLRNTGMITTAEQIARVREEEEKLAQIVEEIGDRFERQRREAREAYEREADAMRIAQEEAARLDAEHKALEEGYFDLAKAIKEVNDSTLENKEAFEIYFEMYEQGIITAQELETALLEVKIALAEEEAQARENTAANKLLEEGHGALAAQVDELGELLQGKALDALKAVQEAYKEGRITVEELEEALNRLEGTVSEEARAEREAAAATRDHADARRELADAAEEQAIAEQRSAAKSAAARARNSAGASFFGIQSSPRAAPGQRRTITGRPIDESGRPAPRGILSFDEGGPVLRDQIAKVHAGEFVLSRQGVGELGRIMAQLINARRAPAVNVSNTFDIQGTPLDNDLRAQARALLPELTRAVRLGVAGKRVL